MKRLLVRAAGAALLSSLALGQVYPEPGVRTADLLDVGDGAYASLSDGGYVSFDGLAFERYDAAGGLVQTYGTVPSPVFPSFVVVDASETAAYVGESSNGDVFTIDLVVGEVTALSNISFNYNMAFDATPGLAYVSAALGGFGTGNSVLRLDLATGQWTQVVHVAGPSGPIAVDQAGDLYYVTQYDGPNWPPPLADEDLLLWTDAQLDSGSVLSAADASYVAAGLDGCSSLAHDPASGDLYLAHVNFQGFANEVLRLTTSGALLGSLGESFAYVSNLELVQGDGEQIMAPYQPAGMQLRLSNVDFGGSIRDRVTLEPQRPTSTFSGPSGGQAGPATVTVLDAPPNGAVSIMVAAASEVRGEVVVEAGWGAPVFFMVAPNELWRRALPQPTDANGAATFQYDQPAGVTGEWVFQALLYDEHGTPVGTSSLVVND